MLQNILVLLLFLGAVLYVGRMIYRSFESRSGCSQGCAKCAVDFDKIARDLQSRKA